MSSARQPGACSQQCRMRWVAKSEMEEGLESGNPLSSVGEGFGEWESSELSWRGGRISSGTEVRRAKATCL